MDTILNEVDFAKEYLDNILFKSGSQEQHAEHVKDVFARIKQYGLKISSNKYVFFYYLTTLSIWKKL